MDIELGFDKEEIWHGDGMLPTGLPCLVSIYSNTMFRLNLITMQGNQVLSKLFYIHLAWKVFD